MATEVVKIVDPDNGPGTNYTSVAAFEAGEQRDLVTADEIAVAKCRCTGGTADGTRVTFGGWTTDSTRYIRVWTDPTAGYRHQGVPTWSGNVYRLYGSFNWSNAIQVDSGHYLKIDGLQIANTTTGLTAYVIVNNGNIWISNSILYGPVVNYVLYNSSGSENYVWNSLVYSDNASAKDGLVGWSDRSAIFYNITMYGLVTGICLSTYGTPTTRIYNCLFYSCTKPVTSSGIVGAANYNATNNASIGYTGSHPNDRLSQTFAFNNAAGLDFHLTGSDGGARDYGTDLSSDSYLSFSNDIDGQTRSGSWDIGMDEYIATGASIPVILYHLRQQRIA